MQLNDDSPHGPTARNIRTGAQRCTRVSGINRNELCGVRAQIDQPRGIKSTTGLCRAFLAHPENGECFMIRPQCQHQRKSCSGAAIPCLCGKNLMQRSLEKASANPSIKPWVTQCQ